MPVAPGSPSGKCADGRELRAQPTHHPAPDGLLGMAGRLAYYINYAYLLVLGPWALQKKQSPHKIRGQKRELRGQHSVLPEGYKNPTPAAGRSPPQR